MGDALTTRTGAPMDGTAIEPVTGGTHKATEPAVVGPAAAASAVPATLH